jgi:hypothetical protein
MFRGPLLGVAFAPWLVTVAHIVVVASRFVGVPQVMFCALRCVAVEACASCADAPVCDVFFKVNCLTS